MTPLDTLKAGIKTAIVTFLTVLVGAVTGLVNEANEWLADRDPVDLSVAKVAVLAGLAALGTGLLNTGLRYLQVAGVPFLASLVTRVLGAVPAYPEADMTKKVTPADETNVIKHGTELERSLGESNPPMAPRA